MAKLIDTLLLLALPASGKSEVRRYMASVSPERCRNEFHMGETVQLDDYPYVHMMRRISQELRNLGTTGGFFDSDAEPMKEPLDWGTLIELINEDYEDLTASPSLKNVSAGAWLVERFDNARAKVGATPLSEHLTADQRTALAAAIDEEAAELLKDKLAGIPDSLDGRTIVIEFARGGAQGSSMPLAAPFGYQYSLSRLSDRILERAAILYVWVTPEESRRKNEERSKPGRDGDASILHHGVPIRVMLEDYGTDDMTYLIEQSGKADHVRVETRGKSFEIPVARVDNRSDLTSFLRADANDWAEQDVKKIHEALGSALTTLSQH